MCVTSVYSRNNHLEGLGGKREHWESNAQGKGKFTRQRRIKDTICMNRRHRIQTLSTPEWKIKKQELRASEGGEGWRGGGLGREKAG